MSSTDRRVFRPGIVPTIATLALAPALAALGLWQLSRADDKQALIDGFTQAASSAPVAVDAATIEPAADRYRRVTLSGTFDATQQVLLDAITLDGQAGFHVLTPLRLADSDQVVMVNRGWLGATGERQPAGELAVSAEPREVRGLVDRFPRAGLDLGGSAAAAAWPRVMLFPEADDISDALGYKVLDWQLLLGAAEPDGFVRRWQPAVEFGPERHVGYAVQWFALCATLLVIFFVVNIKREDA